MDATSPAFLLPNRALYSIRLPTYCSKYCLPNPPTRSNKHFFELSRSCTWKPTCSFSTAASTDEGISAPGIASFL